MNIDLSHRAALAMNTRTFSILSPVERDQFATAIEKAKDFNDLDPKYQHLIIEAEQSLQGKSRIRKNSKK